MDVQKGCKSSDFAVGSVLVLLCFGRSAEVGVNICIAQSEQHRFFLKGRAGCRCVCVKGELFAALLAIEQQGIFFYKRGNG